MLFRHTHASPNPARLSPGLRRRYVAAEKIETLLGRCKLVAQVFVYGDSLQSYLVAVVVPDAEEVAGWAKANGAPSTELAKIVAGAQAGALHDALFAQIRAASKEARLAGFEYVKKIHIEPEVWSVDNGMLTPTFKLKRVDLKKRYQPILDQLYAQAPAAAPTSKL